MHLPKAKILVVDDEPGVLTTVQAVLQREGYDVDAAGDGASALAAIGHTHYDLVLTDLKMPDVDGLAVLAEVRKRSPQTVTVIMTGFGSVGSALEAVQLGAYEYLLKPTEVSELKQAVERSLERKRLSEIDTLYRAGWTITRSLDPNLIATEVSEAVRRVLGVASACLVNLVSLHQPGNGSESLRSVFEDPGLLEALRRGAMVTQHDNFSSLTSWLNENGVASVALVPGIAHERLVCVLCADNGAEPYEFHASAQRFLDALAGQTALALENASLISELRQNNTELAAANRKLQELDKLKSQFLSVATHELRTPLSVILGYNSMLAETLEGKIDDEEKETLRESIAACKRLIRLVNSMLDITQIESGKMRMNVAPADLRQIVNSVAALFHHESRERGVHLQMELPSRLPRLTIDAERIEQVLINLIGNAMKFTEAGGSITVSVRHHAGSIEVAVKDTGIGISAEDQAHIFDEFIQIRRQASTRHRHGSGLGLAIAKRIIEAHAGTIAVSSSPGSGSTFRFAIPLESARNSANRAVTA